MVLYLKIKMANCPNCGSNHIHLKADTNVNWGRAVAGWALFGAVGAAVGAVTGDDKNINACLNCGTSWEAASLYKTLQTIKSLTGVSLDLSEENHRFYMKKFMSEVGSSLESMSKVEKKAKSLVDEAEKKKSESAGLGCASGCLVSILGCHSVIGAATGSTLMLTIFLPPLIGLGIGMLFDKLNKKATDRKFERAKLESERMIAEAERDFRNQLDLFIANNTL
jgi:hypothetical protein